MTAIIIDIEYDDAQIQRALDRLLAAAGDLTEPFNEIGEYLGEVHKARWQQGVDSLGFAWPELTEATWARKKGPGPLHETNTMLNGAVHQATADELLFGPDDHRVPGYSMAAIHHFGVNKSVKVSAHTRRVTQAFGKDLRFPVYANIGDYSFQQALPAREILGINDADEAEILDILQTYVMEAIQG